MYTSSITVNGDADFIEKVFSVEDKDFNRSSFKIKKTSSKITFDINASDATALKTALSTISKVLVICEKAGKITDSKSDSKNKK